MDTRIERIMEVRRSLLSDDGPRSMRELYSECIQIMREGMDSIQTMRVHDAIELFPEPERTELFCAIEYIMRAHIRDNLISSTDDRDILKYLLKHNEPMFGRIIHECKEEWFADHSYKDHRNGKTIKVPGIQRAGNEGLFDFIVKELGLNLMPKQKKSMMDVFSAHDCRKTLVRYSELSPESRSHHGLMNFLICNDLETKVRSCFKIRLNKIPERNRKGHKSPDYLCSSSDVLATVEVYSGVKRETLFERTKEAISHGQSKIAGEQYISELEGTSPYRIATLVVEDKSLDQMFGEDGIRKLQRQRKRMDALLIHFAPPIEEYEYVILIPPRMRKSRTSSLGSLIP